MKVRLNSTYWKLRSRLLPGSSRIGQLPPDVMRHLSRDNPLLRDLKKRYAAATNLQHSFWAPWEEQVNLLKFRGENDYVSQTYFRKNTRRYELTFAYVEVTDELGLLDILTEDRLFGAKVWEFVPDKLVSRDLMDSIQEITFLQRLLDFGAKDRFRVLDIGAGYGRFAHRFTTSFPGSWVTSIDAVATSTFLSDFYLKFRSCERADVVPFDRVSDLKSGHYDLATNIHSWSECTKQFIAFWLDRISDLKIPYLFIVPHSTTLSTVESDGSNLTYDDELERRGFKLVLKQRKFNRSKYIDQMGIFPADYRLYKRESM